ncbi:U4/U6 small nuclear ribonucleoprotein Prp4 [Aphanomyces cochlioides]|nr:U4/U6 small nuclear ribonucleoprotein Prp4 [Aphanomyces cochlioides]
MASERQGIYFGEISAGSVAGGASSTSSSVAAGIRAGNINISDNAERQVLELSASSRSAQEKHAQLLRNLEAEKKARAVNVPTRAEDIIRQLRSLGHPITLFGERPEDRRARLRSILSALEVDGISIQPRPSQEVGWEKEKKIPIEDQLFYVPVKANDLKYARQAMFNYSMVQTNERLQKERAQLEKTVFEADAHVADLYRNTQNIVVNSSQLADVRPLSSIRYSPDASLVATGSWSSNVKLWDAKTSALVHTFHGHIDRITGVAWHPQFGQSKVCLASGSADATAMIWKQDEQKPVVTLKGHQSRLGQIAFHPMGSYLATASFDYTWRLWDIEKGTELLLQEGHYREVYAIACQGDGALCATGDLGGVGRVWDLRSGKSIMALQGHAKQIVSMCWNPNGYVIASGSDDHSVRIWDVRKRQNVYVVPAHDGMVSAVRFSASGELLATSSFDGSIKLWRSRNWTCLSVLKGHDGKVMSLDMAPDEKHLVSAGFDRTFKSWAHESEI